MASKGNKSGVHGMAAKSVAPRPEFVATPATFDPVAAFEPVETAVSIPPMLAATPSPIVDAAPVVDLPLPVPAPVEPVARAAPEHDPAPAVADAPPEAPPEAPEVVFTPAPAIAGAFQKEVTKMEDTIQSATDTVKAQAQTAFADVNASAKSALQKGSKMIEDMKDFSKGNIEAIVESSKIAAKGVEAMGQEAADYGRRQFESATVAFKSLSTVKSPTDFFKLQSDYVRSTFDAMVAETSKNTETMLKLAGEVAQPISNRVAIAAEKLKIAA